MYDLVFTEASIFTWCEYYFHLITLISPGEGLLLRRLYCAMRLPLSSQDMSVADSTQEMEVSVPFSTESFHIAFHLLLCLCVFLLKFISSHYQYHYL